MGGKSTQKTDASIDPWSKQQYTNAANTVSNTLNSNPFQPYTGQMIAGQNPMESEAANYFMSNRGAGSGLIGSAAEMAKSVGGYSPILVSGGAANPAQNYQAQRVTADKFAGANLDPYMNPYIDQVVDTSLSDLDRSRQMAIQSGQAAASQAGAYGGSRHGVADSLTNEAALRTAASTSAGLRSQGFDRAAGLFGQDADRSLTARLANQGADLSAAGLRANAFESGQGRSLQAALANQGAGQNAAGLRLQGAGLLGDLGRTQSDMVSRDAFATAAFGEAARNIDQATLDSAYQEFLRQQQDPFMRAQIQQGLLSSVPIIQDGTTTVKQSPGILGVAGGLLQGAGALSGLGLFGGGK